MVVDGELIVSPAARPTRYELRDSPLWRSAGDHCLWGRIVTDPAEVARIRAHIAHARLSWWRRLLSARPGGW